MAKNDVHGPVAVVETCFNIAIAGVGGFTISEALAVLPFPVPVAETLPLVLLYVPTVGPVTLTVTVQLPPPVTVPPVKLTEPAPATGAKVGEPQPLVEAPVGFATTILPGEIGKVSEKATPLRESF